MAPPLLTGSGLPRATREGRIYCLYPALPGAAAREGDLERPGAHATAVADALARLHGGLRSYPRPDHFPRLDLAGRVVDEVLPAMAKRPRELPVAAARRIGHEVATALEALRPGVHEQLVHRDPQPSNLLFEDGGISGIVDFDAVANSLRLFDPCYFALTLLRSRWRDPQRRNAWPALSRSFLRAWARSVEPTAEERRACRHVFLAVQLDLVGFNLKLGDLDAARHNTAVLRWLYEHLEEIEPFAGSRALPARGTG